MGLWSGEWLLRIISDKERGKERESDKKGERGLLLE